MDSPGFPMNICLILNPKAGHLRRNPGVIREVQKFAAERGGRVAFQMTTGAGHAVRLAAAAAEEGCDLVVAVGGDGTMNEVARGLFGTAAALGLVPCGSGNGLARHLGIPLRPADALRLLEQGPRVAIDVGRANGHPFLCAAGVGFEVHIAALFNRRQRRGFFSYVATSLREWRAYIPASYRIAGPELEPFERTAFTVAVANAAQYGNGARIAPTARIDDGRLDLVAIPPVRWSNALPLLIRLFRGRLLQDRGVRHVSGPRFELSGPAALAFHTDGEVHSPASPSV
jgi:diacylglycerol kinase (ATP)